MANKLKNSYEDIGGVNFNPNVSHNDIEKPTTADDLSKAEQQATDDLYNTNKSHKYSDSNNLAGEENQSLYNKNDQSNNKSKSKFDLKGLLQKQKSILLAAGIGGGGIMGGALLGGSFLLPVHVSEMMSDKINSNSTLLEGHAMHLRGYKLFGNNASCKGFKCTLSTMSEREVKRMNAAGFELEDANGKKLTGKGRPAKVIDAKGNAMDAKAFDSRYKTDAAFRKSLRGVYNPKYAGLVDKSFTRLLSRVGIRNLNKIIKGNSADEISKSMQDVTTNAGKGGATGVGGTVKQVEGTEDFEYCDSSQKCQTFSGNDAEEKAKNAQAADLDANKAHANSLADDAKKAVDPKSVSFRNVVSKFNNWFSVTGNFEDKICGTYNATRTVDFLIKTWRRRSLIAFAITFMNTAGSIKAGDATAEQVSDLGARMTEVLKDQTGEILQGSFTDSFGYQYAAFNAGRGDMTANSGDFTMGTGGGVWGLIGDMIQGVYSGISGALGDKDGSSIDKTCATVRSLGYQLASAGVGVLIEVGSWVAGAFTGGAGKVGVEVAKTAIRESVKKISQFSIKKFMQKTFSKAMGKKIWEFVKNKKTREFLRAFLVDYSFDLVLAYASEYMAELQTGVLDTTTNDGLPRGERMGDAVTPGLVAADSDNCSGSGCLPLSTEEALIFAEQRQQSALAFAEEERVGSNWWDISNSYTALGSISRNLSMSLYGSNSVMSFVNKLSSLFGSSIRSTLSPSASALELNETYECGNKKIVESGMACDVFENVPTGLTKILSPDQIPDGVYDMITDSGEPVPDTEYENFVNRCAERQDNPQIAAPYGAFSNEPVVPIGDDCMQEKYAEGNKQYQNYYYANLRAYARVQGQMDGSTMEYSGGTNGKEDGTTGPPGSYTAQCPANTNDLGIYDSAHDGDPNTAISVRLCELTSIIGTPKGQYDPDMFTATGAIVSAKYADAFQRMGEAAKADGVQMSGKGIRSYEQQVYFWNCYQTKSCNNGNLAAQPGASNHENGTAIDFVITGQTLNWLRAHGSEYGFKELSTEAWHWSPGG
jgi:hypothetical protein